jgi:hypothetical protein
MTVRITICKIKRDIGVFVLNSVDLEKNQNILRFSNSFAKHTHSHSITPIMLTIWHASTSFIYACARIQHRSFFFSVPLETLKKIELILTISWKTGKMFGDIKSEYRSLVSRKRTRGKEKSVLLSLSNRQMHLARSVGAWLQNRKIIKPWGIVGVVSKRWATVPSWKTGQCMAQRPTSMGHTGHCPFLCVSVNEENIFRAHLHTGWLDTKPLWTL